jgi:hypothetical protein
VLNRLAPALFAVFFLPSFSLGAEPNAPTIIERSVDANDKDWAADPRYSYKETDRDGHGSKTYQVTMIEGSPYRELIAVNGRPLSADNQAKQQRDKEKTAAARRAESPSAREKRVSAYNADRKRDHILMGQLTQAFEFRRVGTARLGPHKVYKLEATPRPAYRPPNLECQVLRGMRGELWIDQATFQWVRVTARVISPVSIEGFLARVEPGTYFELEKKPVAPNIWLPSHFQMKSDSKILFMVDHRTEANETYFDYQPEEQQDDNSDSRSISSKSLPVR